MARPINHGPPACATAPSTTRTITHASVHRYGDSSEARRLAVVARSAAFSSGAPAMDWMLLISGLLGRLHLMDEPVLAGAEDGVPAVEAPAAQTHDHHLIPELLGLVSAPVPDALPDGPRHALDGGLVHDVQGREGGGLYPPATGRAAH